jgi:hypothetical protein
MVYTVMRRMFFVMSICAIFNCAQASFFSSADTNWGTLCTMSIRKENATVINNGDYYALKDVVVEANTFEGSGYIEAPTVIIRTKKFAFIGIIHCHNDCIIYVEEPFDEEMFTRKGEGKFTIVVGTPDKHAQFQLEEHISIMPLVNAVLQFPTHNPITAIVALGCVIGTVGYKLYSAK